MSRPISTRSCTRSPSSRTTSADGGGPVRRGTPSSSASAWGGEDWFRLGDLDLGLHLVRTQGSARRSVALDGDGAARGASGARDVASSCRRTTGSARTSSRPPDRSSSRSGSSAVVTETRSTRCSSKGRETASPAPGVIEALASAEAIVIAPSNPYVSIGPILAVEGIRRALEQRSVRSRRREPAHRRQGGQGPGRPYALAHGGRNDTLPCSRALLGLGRRPRHRRGGRAGGCAGRARRHGHADARPSRGATSRRSRPGAARARSGRRRNRAVRARARDASERGGLRRRHRLSRRDARRRAGRGDRRRRSDECRRRARAPT